MESNNQTNASVLNTNSTLIDKLRPSSRNKLIGKKYKILSSNKDKDKDKERDMDKDRDIPNRDSIRSRSEMSQNDLRNWGIDPILSSDTFAGTFNEQWNTIVKLRKQETLQLDLSASCVFADSNINNLDESVFSENLEYINNFIEENYQMVLTENIFITNLESYHSILPFLLISSKEIHRMTLSDYEIKLVFKSFKNKIKTNRIDGMDYYKIGLINFYQGKFLIAYSNFKMAYNLRKEANFAKWLAFTSLIIVFCHKSNNEDNTHNSNNYNNLNNVTDSKLSYLYPNIKIKFYNLRNVIIYDDREDFEEEESFLFGCCTNRKKKTLNLNINMNINLKTTDHINSNSINSEAFLNNQSGMINKFSLCKEIENLLLEAITLDKEEKHLIEVYWIYMIISCYCYLNPQQKVFKTEIISSQGVKIKIDPKCLVKKIKEKEVYLGYLAYAEFSYLIDPKFNIKSILSELISKFPNKIEAYLRFWNLLVKGSEKEKDFKLAHQLSEVFWKNSSTLNLDNNIYYLYITITHAKSLYYLGNNFYTITYFQKEYPANFLYPSIFYLFGKYSSKSNSKSLKSAALSSLYQVYKLLYKDLQKSTLYWIGNVYYNSGSYDLCYKFWKLYIEHPEDLIDLTVKKIQKIQNFKKNYELLGNSLLEFKKNLNYIKRDNSNKFNYIKDDFEISDQLKDFLSDLKAIKEIEPNIREDNTIKYEFYRGLVHHYVEQNLDYSMRLFMNCINTNNYYMDAYFALWKIIKSKSEFKCLLNFSYFMVKNSHSQEVSHEDWIKSYVLYAKALFLNERYDDAVELLRNMLDIFANIPLDGIKFLSEVHKSNKIFTTNNFVNFDYALSFYSKYHVYKKSEAIFQFNYKSIKAKGKDIFIGHNLKNENELKEEKKNKFSSGRKKASKSFAFISMNTMKELDNSKDNIKCDLLSLDKNNVEVNENYFVRNTNEEDISGMNEIQKEVLYPKFDLDDININSIEKLEEHIEKYIDGVEISEEYTFVTIISNPVILYQIGKMCAKSCLKSEMGLYCLKDYVSILKFQYNYELENYHLLKKYKAYFYMGVLYAFLHLYKNSKETFEKIKNISIFEDKINKINFIKAFFDFYKKFQSHNKEEFNFELNKKYL